MGQESQEQQNNETGAAGGSAAPDKQQAGAGGQALGTATRAPVFPSQAAGTQDGSTTQGQGGATTSTTQAPTTRKLVDTNQIPPDALKARLDRARMQGQEVFLKELGVKTPEEAREKLKTLKNAEQEGEKRRLAELSEVERYKAELSAAQQRITELEAQLAERDQEREHEQHEQVIVRVAGEMLNPKAMRLYKLDLAQHVKKLHVSNPDLAERFGERGIRRFTEKWLKDNPEFAKPGDVSTTTTTTAAPGKPGATRPAASQVPPVRRPVSTGAPVRKLTPPPVNGAANGANGMLNGKTIKPGRPNSMTPAEAKEYARQHGVNYNPM